MAKLVKKKITIKKKVVKKKRIKRRKILGFENLSKRELNTLSAMLDSIPKRGAKKYRKEYDEIADRIMERFGLRFEK